MSDAAPQLSAAPFDAADGPPSVVLDCPLRLDVIATDAGDVVRSAGGWLFNRSHHGWAVNVFLAEHYEGPALQILGAKVFPLQSLSELPTPSTRPHLLAVAAGLFGDDNRARDGVAKAMTQARGRVVVWGDAVPTKVNRRMENLQHRLTPAGRAFKVHAMRAVTAEDIPLGPSEDFWGRPRAMSACDFDLIAKERFPRASPVIAANQFHG